MRFKVLKGKHHEPMKKGIKSYAQGECVETEVDLVAKHGRAKFLRVDDPEKAEAKAKARRKPPIVDPDDNPDEDDPKDPSLTPIHKGGGSWGVYDENDEKTHGGWLTKEAAFALADTPLDEG